VTDPNDVCKGGYKLLGIEYCNHSRALLSVLPSQLVFLAGFRITMGLSVKSARCASTSMIIFGSIFMILAIGYIIASVFSGYILKIIVIIWAQTAYDGLSAGLAQLVWYLGYPMLLALIVSTKA
jgi:hypothetical protein